MAALTFDRPQILFSFAGFVLFIMLGAFHYYKYRSVLGFFLKKKALVQELKFRYLCSTVFFGIFLGCVIIALAGPRWGQHIVMEYRRGVDVVLALDLSRSMEVADIILEEQENIAAAKGSRLDRAIQVALETIADSEGIRFGAAVGKSRGILAIPLTYDIETILHFLEGLSSSIITGGGTNLEALLDAASSAFLDAFPTHRGIILFSDGEAWSGSLGSAIDRILEAGITVIVLGVGAETGGAVPQDTPDLVDQEPSISYRRTEVLRNIAERTGGVYIDGNRRDAPELLSAHLRGLSPESGIKGYHLESQARWQIFIIIALLSLVISKLFEKRRRIRA
ncbi:MAG: VWA domain-containing protein [Treponema sp.]|jgi:Ca-activated chloride channel family protein|nr:VWA domain-containing protein [Treponema sp.]